MNTPQKPRYVWQRPDWPNWTYDATAVQKALTSARLSQGKLLGAISAIGFGTPDIDAALGDIRIYEVLATAAIEGEVLNLEQVRSSVKRKVSGEYVGSTSRHIDGLIDMMEDAIANHDKPLDEERLVSWQAALFPTGRSGLIKIQVGQYRSFDSPMQILSGKPGQETVHYQAPASKDVPAEMERFLGWLNRREPMDSIVKAAIAHAWFETIHPFEDGNGRIGRAIIDRTIAEEAGGVQGLYSMTAQLKAKQSGYYEKLSQAQHGNLDVTDWVIWFADQFGAACDRSMKYIDTALQKARFKAQHAQDSFNERQAKVLQKLLDAGDGGFLGGLTREKYVKITACSDATATRDLTDMQQKKALIAKGTGKGTKYFVNVPGWHAETAGPSGNFLAKLAPSASKKDSDPHL